MRDLSTAVLERKELISRSAQCFHLEFRAEEPLAFTPGQFLSCVAEDARGKQQTRAYSLASVPQGEQFALCLNRVENGFFSNLLCDLEPGETIAFHGPHGTFCPREPMAASLWIAAETGVAPFRAFAEWLFAEDGKRASGHDVWLVCEAASEDGFLYRDFFSELAARGTGFHYRPLIGNETGAALRDEIAHVVKGFDQTTGGADRTKLTPYVCGLNAMVAPMRAHLVSLGWERRMVEFERYD